MAFLKKILSSSTVASIVLFALTVHASPESCSNGYKELKQSDYPASIESLSQCIATLLSQEDTKYEKLVWAHYLTAKSYYELEDFSEAHRHAYEANYWKNVEESSLGDDESEFLAHILRDTKPEYRTTLRSMVEIDFSLSEGNGCDEDSISFFEGNEASTFLTCKGDEGSSRSQNSFRSGASIQNNVYCKNLLKKYKGCQVLYCENGGYQLSKPFYETGPRKITCNQEEIEFYSAPAYMQKAAVADALLGPLGHNLESDRKRSSPSLLDNPF